MEKVFENSECYREIPTMTRSEYVNEYGEILEYYEKQREKEKKLLPVYIIVAILGLLFIIYGIYSKHPVFLLFMVIFTVPFSARNRQYYRRCGLSTKEMRQGASLSLFFLFPIGSYINRIKQIEKIEQKQLKDLEERKTLCISMGTYKAEE